MKAPNKNSIISKMIRYPFWFLGKTEANWDELDLPKTSCGYGFIGGLLGLFNVIIITNVLVFVLGALEIIIAVWLGEIFNLITYGSGLMILEYADLVGSTILGALFFGFMGCVMALPAGIVSVPVLIIILISKICTKLNVREYLCKAFGVVFISGLSLKVYTALGKLFKPLKMAYKSLHKKLCVPMEYKDE